MTTKFPQLPVMGRTPKKRVEDLTRTVTLEQAYAILESEWLEYQLDDYRYGQLLKAFKAVAKK